jgi:hypothetical protein
LLVLKQVQDLCLTWKSALPFSVFPALSYTQQDILLSQVFSIEGSRFDRLLHYGR